MIKPTYDRVLVKKIESNNRISGSLFLTEDSNAPIEATVIGVGIGEKDDNTGARTPMEIKIGDTLLVLPNRGIPIDTELGVCYLMEAQDIVARDV